MVMTLDSMGCVVLVWLCGSYFHFMENCILINWIETTPTACRELFMALRKSAEVIEVDVALQEVKETESNGSSRISCHFRGLLELHFKVVCHLNLYQARQSPTTSHCIALLSTTPQSIQEMNIYRLFTIDCNKIYVIYSWTHEFYSFSSYGLAFVCLKQSPSAFFLLAVIILCKLIQFMRLCVCVFHVLPLIFHYFHCKNWKSCT